MSDVLPIGQRDRRPLPVIVRSELERMIQNGDFSPGAQLPSEDELAELFSVSRPTVRQALGSMEADGVVVRRRGVGTFVSGRPLLRNNLDINFGVTDLITAHGRTPGTKDKIVREAEADDEEAAILQLPPGSPLLRLERVRTSDGLPVVFSVDVLPRALSPDASFEHESVYGLLHAVGVKVHHGVAHLSPIRADAGLARKLGVPRGSSLLLLDQVDFDPRDRPVVHSREWHLPNAFDITVYRKGPDQ